MRIVLGVLIAVTLLAIPLSFILHLFAAIFSRRVRAGFSRRKRLHFIWFLAAVVAIAVMLAPGNGGRLKATRQIQTGILMGQIQTAFENYPTEYSTPPKWKDNASLIRCLSGDNPRHIEFLTLRPKDLDASGNVLDAWGTPFRIFPPSDGITSFMTIQSAGPDKIWGTPDDLTAFTNLGP